MVQKIEERIVRPDEIHIHILRSRAGEARSGPESLLALLSWDEKTEYGTIERSDRQWEFFWSRLLLRGTLASYLKRNIKDLRFKLGPKGKPSLEEGDLEFNLSHTEGLIACSIGHRKLGIDVERLDGARGRTTRWELLARRYFSEAEKEYLFSREPEEREALFFKIFTLKEALVKAEGLGLSRSLSGFSVPLPLTDKCQWGPWECLTQRLGTGDIFMAHVAEDPAKIKLDYKFFEWDEKSLELFLNEHFEVPKKGNHVHLHG